MAILVSAGVVSTLYGLYFVVIAVWGSLKPPVVHPYAAPKYRLAVLVPARNEAGVLPDLIRSLDKQRYPKSLFDVYVLPNNCTDDTEAVARRAGARTLSCDRPVASKGEVLGCAFRLLENASYDGYVVFDADNVVDAGFLQAANNALADGCRIAQGHRDSKNPYDSWISGCSSVFYWCMNRFFNRPRAALGMSASLNGTGMLLSSDLIREHGWDVNTLTEDLEYTAFCATRGVRVGWMEDAVTYDEQPVSLADSFTQRRRWTAGSLQCLRKFRSKLFTGGSACRDVLTLFMGAYINMIGLIAMLATVWMMVGLYLRDPRAALINTLTASAFGVVTSLLTGAALALLAAYAENKPARRLVPAILLMGLFLFTWFPANLLCLFTRPPRWKAIPHTAGCGDVPETARPAKNTTARTRPARRKARGAAE